MSQLKAIVDKLLTDVSQKYVPEDMVSEMLLPELKVKQSSGKIGKYGLAHLRIVSTVMGGRGGAKNLSVRQYASDSYFLEPHGLEDIITPEEYDNVEQPFDIESDVSETLTGVLFLEKEFALASTLTDTAVITQNVTLAGNNQLSDYANSDPIGVFKTARLAIHTNSGAIANTAVVPYQVAETLRYHPKILAALGFQYNRAGQLTDQELAVALGVKKVLIPNCNYNSAKEGQADVMAPVWGKNIVFCSVPESAGKKQKTLGYMVVKASEGTRKVYKAPLHNPPEAVSVIVKDTYDIVLTDVTCAYLVKAAIA